MLGKGSPWHAKSAAVSPEQHTEFCFFCCGEEVGLFKACLFSYYYLFFILLYRGLCIAFNSKNLAGSVLALCLVFLLFWQIII